MNGILKVLYAVAGLFIGKKEMALASVILSIATYVAKLTKNTVDDAVLASIASIIYNETKTLSRADIEKVAEAITNKKRGPLKKFGVKISHKRGITVEYGNRKIEYSHTGGNFRCLFQ